MQIRTGIVLNPLEVPIKAGADVGGVKVMAGEQTRELRLRAESALPAPTRWWRIKR
jgi:hypothetical protein